MPRPVATSTPQDAPIRALVWLLARPRPLTEVAVREACEAAWGHPPKQVAGDGNSFLVEDGPTRFLVNSVPQRYAPTAGSGRNREILSAHQAWLSVDYLDGDLKTDQIYAVLGPLAAVLAGPDCLGLFSPEHKRLAPYDSKLVLGLRGGGTLMVLGLLEDDTVEVSAESAEMEAAVQRARSEFSKFRSLWKAGAANQSFFVKHPFGEQREHMWVTVEKLGPDQIQGVLANDSELDPALKVGRKVEVRVLEITDWLVTEGDRVVGGGFTNAVLGHSTGGQGGEMR